MIHLFGTVDQQRLTEKFRQHFLSHRPGIHNFPKNGPQEWNGDLNITGPEAAAHFASVLGIADKMDHVGHFKRFVQVTGSGADDRAHICLFKAGGIEVI